MTGPDPSTRVAAFYYPWYFNPDFDGKWDHWGEGHFNPPQEIASDYYPLLGTYSMSDPAVLAQHFAWLREAGVGLIVSSWWGRGDPTDRALPLTIAAPARANAAAMANMINSGLRVASRCQSGSSQKLRSNLIGRASPANGHAPSLTGAHEKGRHRPLPFGKSSFNQGTGKARQLRQYLHRSLQLKFEHGSENVDAKVAAAKKEFCHPAAKAAFDEVEAQFHLVKPAGNRS